MSRANKGGININSMISFIRVGTVILANKINSKYKYSTRVEHNIIYMHIFGALGKFHRLILIGRLKLGELDRLLNLDLPGAMITVIKIPHTVIPD